MPEPETTAPELRLEMGDLIAIARRRLWAWLSVFSLILVGTVTLAYTLPPVYKSSAKILVQLQEMPDDVVSSTIGGYVEARLSALDQRIQSSDSLLKLIDKYNLYPELAEAGLETEMVGQARASIIRESSAVEVAGPSGRTGTATVYFILSFEHEKPALAQKAAGDLAEMYLAENSRLRVETASDVSRFLKDEAARVARDLEEVDAKIAAFKEQHVNELPEQNDMNRRMLEDAENNIIRSEQRIMALDDRRRDLETSIRLQNANRLTVGELLDMRRSELAQAESRYSPLHPDVKRLKKEVEDLKAQLNDPSKVFVLGEEGVKAYDSSANIALQSQLSEVKSNLQVEREAVSEMQRKIAQYEQRLLGAPAIEKEYQQLSFERDNLSNALGGIKQKQLDAELAVQLELQSKGERFTLVEPATLPTDPERPNRPALVLLGLVFAIGASVGLVALIERFDTSVHGATAIARIMRAPPLASIPVIHPG